MHTVIKIDKHPIIHSTIQQDKEGIVEKINDANDHAYSIVTQQDKLPRDEDDILNNSSGPKTMELSKDRNVIPKHSQDEEVVQIAELMKQYQILFTLNDTTRKGMVEDLERMKTPFQL